MIVIETVADMQSWSEEKRKQGKRIGLAPTMGALHDGHASLIARAREENDEVVVSIFLNPKQFSPGEDLDSYPKTFSMDQKVCESLGTDVIFFPGQEEVYPEGFSTTVSNSRLTRGLCGSTRPNFFDGITTVVTKLVNIVNPHRAYFGEKDYQQLQTVRQVVRDLNMAVEIVACPLVREADGLALSSRNAYLSDGERAAALLLSRSLFAAKEWIASGDRDSRRIAARIRETIDSHPLCSVEYVALVDADNLLDRPTVEGTMCIAVAARVGSTRLIDNVLIDAI